MASKSPTVFSNKNPHFPIPNPHSTNQQIPSKSHSNCLRKSSLIVIILLAIPLFPSQAPDFITECVITEFWDIIYLLFIGIAVSYGLFGRKTTENPSNDAFVTEISNLSSVFEDGFGNVYGSDAQNGEKIESFVGTNESWCCQNLKSEASVVVSNGKCFVDKSSDVKPLNLPVRSLRSSIVENDKKEVKISPKFAGKGVCDAKVVKIRGVVPKNLEKRFEEVSGDSLIPWRSRSIKLEKGEEMSSFKSHSHCRPQSVGEIEFKRINDMSDEDLTFSSLESSKEGMKWEFWQKKNSRRGNDYLVIEASKNGVRNGPFSIGSGLEMKRLDNGGEESGVEKGQQGVIEQLGFDVKSPTLAKVLSRAKSVRTIKPNRLIKNEEQTGTMFNKFKDLRVNRENQEVDSIFRMPKPNPILHEDIGHGSVTDSEYMRSVFDKSEYKDDSETNFVSDAELGSEVDRKAGEFIAKIKAQIRLQKTDSSVKGYGGW